MKKAIFSNQLFTGKHLLAIFTLIMVISVTSCKKDDDSSEPSPTNNNTNTTPETPRPSFIDGKGVMVAIQAVNVTSSPIGPVTTTLGLAVAVFYDNPASNTFLEAGNVTAESKTLTKQSNNAYVFQPSSSDITGIDYSSGDVHWEVSGMGDVPAIDELITMGFPSVGAINSDETVTKSSGYTLSTSTISGADSVIFQVGDVLRTAAGNVKSYTFTSTDLSGLDAGTSLAQIAAFKVEDRSSGGEIHHFVNETAVSQTVTIE